MNSNLFITFEGPEGRKNNGHSNDSRAINKNNIEVLATREPGGIEIAEKNKNDYFESCTYCYG